MSITSTSIDYPGERSADLCAEAIRLGRLLIDLLPERSEPRGLLALMLLHDSRRITRVDAQGDLVLLEEQDRDRWDRDQISEGSALVEAALRAGPPGPCSLQAAIAALHAQAPTAAETDWHQIAALYHLLHRQNPTAIVELNRAVAVAGRTDSDAAVRTASGWLSPPTPCRLVRISSHRGR